MRSFPYEFRASRLVREPRDLAQPQPEAHDGAGLQPEQHRGVRREFVEDEDADRHRDEDVDQVDEWHGQ